MKNINKPKTRNANIVVQEMRNEILIYDLKENKAFCLNETSSLIYQLCDGNNSIAEITRKLNKTLNQNVSDEFIWLAVDGLKKENLLEDNEQFKIDFNGLNRRQIIKKVGLASMIALPLISSVVAPSAAMAQSGGSALLYGACTSPSDCSPSAPFCRSVVGGVQGGTQVCCVNGNTGTRGFQGSVLGTRGSSCAECYQNAATNCCSSAIAPGSCFFVPTENAWGCTSVCI